MEVDEASYPTIFLVGDVASQIICDFLPSQSQVLKLLFFHLQILNESVESSVPKVIDEVALFWQKFGIPIQLIWRCRDKLLNLYTEWRTLCKHKGRNLSKEREFTASLEKLFDIAHGDAMTLIDERLQQFLSNQRNDVGLGFTAKEELPNQPEAELPNQPEAELLSRPEEEEDTQRVTSSQSCADDSTEELAQSLSYQTSSALSISSEELFQPGPSNPKRSRACVNILTENLVGALDRFNVTDRQAVHIIGAVCTALNDVNALSVSVDDLVINRSSIRRERQRRRELMYAEIQQRFHISDVESTSFVIHWDGKLLPDLLGGKNVDRLPIVATAVGKEYLLGVPALESGSGIAQATKIYETLCDWGICDSVKALCCDTTASNLGRFNGAAVQLEKQLGRELLLLPCRHHIYELVLRSAFEQLFPVTVGPNVPVFQKFRTAWNDMDPCNYKSGMEDETVSIILHNKVTDIERIVSDLLTENFARNDYKEFLELVLVFLGCTPNNFQFKKPGAVHHARWMAKGIYALKIYLLREEFRLSKKDETGLRDLCMFIAVLYVQAWFTAPVATKAPSNDLLLLKNLCTYKSINKRIAEAALKKFVNHLWYLGSELAVMSLFDNDVSFEVKSRMVDKLKQESEIADQTMDDENNDYTDEQCYNDEVVNQEIDFFVTDKSIHFFERFALNTDFLQIHPSEWKEDKSYLAALSFVKSLRVVNDVAERMVKLMEDFNGKLTKDENQLQFMLQVIKEHREKFPINVTRAQIK